jgi:surface carbohydrate biosynthesis protein
MTPRWLYLPIDVKVREIEAKTFLALQAARRGYHVVIGRKQSFPSVMDCYPPGHYLGFGSIGNFKNEYLKLCRRGHGILLQDEEGLVTHSEKIYVRNRLRPDVLELGEMFVAWGNVQANLLKKHRAEHARLAVVSGNPRFDVLRPEHRHLYDADVKKLRAQYGDYIMISSSFGSCNHYTGRENYLQSLRNKKVIQSEEDFAYYTRYFNYRLSMMQEFLKMLPALRATFPGSKIVIRPHPSENVDTWKNATKDLADIHVIHEGSAIPWLIGAGAIIQNFCTTSIEAFALGLSPIAYKPIYDQELETPLPSLASIQAHSQDELMKAVRGRLNREPDAQRGEKEKLVQEYVANINGLPAGEVILDALEKLQLRPGIFGKLGPVIHGVRKTLEKAKNIALRQGKSEYITHKFPGLELEEMRGFAKRMGASADELSRMKMRKIHEGCILIEPF